MMVADAGSCFVDDVGGGMLRRRRRVAAAAACMVGKWGDGALGLAVVVGEKSVGGRESDVISGQVDGE